MKTKDVVVGKVYWARVSGKLTEVRVLGCLEPLFAALNLSTGRTLALSAARLRYEPGTVHLPRKFDGLAHVLCYCASLPGTKCDFCSGLRVGTLDDFRSLIGTVVQGRNTGRLFKVKGITELMGHTAVVVEIAGAEHRIKVSNVGTPTKEALDRMTDAGYDNLASGWVGTGVKP